MGNKNLHAFTLVELALVLIIIGLAIGGVLYGQDLIRAGQMRLQIAQLDKTNTAIATFRTKYDCLPGDCASAVSLGLGVSGGDGDNGNGNGYIESTSITALDGPEMRNLWVHLSNAGLISWSGTAGLVPGVNSPPLALKGQAIASGSATQNPLGGMWAAEIGTSSRLPAHINGWVLTAISSNLGPVYLPLVAYTLDTKIDDGLPGTGIMNVTGAFNAVACGGMCILVAPPSASDFGVGVTCINDLDVPVVYDLTTTDITANSLCEPAIRWSN